MKSDYIPKLSVIWTNRKKNLKECTEDLIIFLERLKTYDPRLGSWYVRGYTKKEALENKVDLKYDFIKKQLCKKCEETDYPEFTYLTGFWNGGKTDSLSYGISFSLGGNNSVGTNNCSLTFPYEGELYEHYRIRENWEKLLELFIDHWNPYQYINFEDQLIDL